MTGRPGRRTVEMNGGSSAPYLACTPCVPLFCTLFNRGWKHQEPRKGGFSKGGFCRVECHAQGNKEYPRTLGPAVHLALRAPQPRKAYILQKPPSKNPLFLVSENRRAFRLPGAGGGSFPLYGGTFAPSYLVSICHKGQSCQEVVLKFFWASGARVRKKSLALVRTLFCTGATLFRTSARDFFLTLSPEGQKNFSTTSWQLCPFWQIDSLSRHQI